MTNTQKSLFNCVNDIQKAHFEVYSNITFNYKYVVGNYSATLYFNVTCLNWQFMEKIKDITDKRSISWNIKVDGNGYLFIELNK